MKNVVYALLLLVFVSSCSNNSEEPAVDCSNSDLTLSIKSSEKPGCDSPGSVTLEATGGSGDYTYSSNGTDFTSSATINDLSAGSLTFTVKDSDGCTATVSTVLDGEANSVSISVEKVDSDCSTNNGSATVTASGGDGSYLYSIDGGAGQSSNVFSALGPGTYTVGVTDGAGCSATQDISIDADISLESDIVPIINANCAISGCHVSGGQSPNLSSSSSIINSSSSIKARTGAGTMPPASRPDLTDLEIDQIACWVDSGAKNN